jgi:glycosyltransferase involved in cell wall biosynthesis
MNFWIAIPLYNEEVTLPALLARLAAMAKLEEFNVVFCDNNSTDRSSTILNDFIKASNKSWVVVHEEEKGTGAAADTAIREAIRRGATHVARTDADCLPALNWVAVLKNVFKTTTLRLISGRITARMDDTNITQKQANFFDKVVPFAASFGRFRPMNQGKQFKGPYVMTAGCNMAIESHLYEECGGFTRTKIEDVHEDHMLINAVRRVTSEYKYLKDVHVEVSARRIAEWGTFNTLRWYANHSYKPEVVDIR